MLTIIIPVYNEINTIEKILDKIDRVNFISKEIILVDDGSTDGTVDLIKEKLLNRVTKVIFHKKNQGKGSAIKSAKNFINGDFVIIQDADLEYDPNDYQKLLDPIIEKKFKVVYGSRVLGKPRYSHTKNFTSLSRIFFNHILTIFSNIVNNQNLTDAHTCYKVFKTEIFNKINLVEKGFSFCPEITSKVSRLNLQIKEIAINYNGRTKSEGKKIGIRDGFEAIYTLIKYGLFKLD